MPDPVPAFPGYEEELAELDEDEFDFEDFSRKVHRVPELAEALDRMWPRLSPHELLHDLFGARPLIAAAARGVLTPEEQELLHRPRSASFDAVPWTPADAALVDEARHLLGPRQGRSEDAVRRYGHIVVDEVQDLSPMQLRMVSRRSLSGSMTVVGDIAQATAPWAPSSWSDITDHLPRRRPVRTVELTVSYRTPAEVLAVAGRVLALAAPELVPPRPVRRTGVDPRMVAVRPPPGEEGAAGSGDVARTAAEVVAEELVAVEPGRVAVLAPEDLLPALSDALAAAGMPVVDARDARSAGLSARAGPARRRRGQRARVRLGGRGRARAHRRRDGRGSPHPVRGAHPADPTPQRGAPGAAAGRPGGRLRVARPPTSRAGMRPVPPPVGGPGSERSAALR